MAKWKRDVGREIPNGLRELKRGDSGRVLNVPDVAAVRRKNDLSQSRFASLLGVSVRSLQNWEQGRRAPCSSWRAGIPAGYCYWTWPTRGADVVHCS